VHGANEEIRLNLMLADSAQVAGGKLFILGGAIGWSLPDVPTPMAICGTIDIPWNETNVKRTISIDMIGDNKQSAIVPTATGSAPFKISAQFEAGRPSGAPKGTTFTIPFAVQFIRPPLAKGRYEFVVRLDGSHAQTLTLDLVDLLPN
jgi:hypothetical protein